MAIIYSYPNNNDIQSSDRLIGTSTTTVAGRKKNLTKNFTVAALANFLNYNHPTPWGTITGDIETQTDLWDILESKQGNITLTTIGTSGAATLVGATLNIPTYPMLTATSSLTNDGSDGVNPFITAEDLPSSFGLFAQIADGGPVTATATETTIIGPGVGTITVPANAFKIGDSFAASLDGIISCVGAATLHVKVKTLTGVLLADTGIINMDTSTTKSWLLNLYFTIRTIGGTGIASISSGGLFSYIKNSGTNFEGYVLNTINTTTFDTTIDNTLDITVQWNTNNAGNSILSRNFTLTKVY